jgi:hypothetical protein
VGKADFLVFRAMNQHGFLGQLQEKKLVSFLSLLFILFIFFGGGGGSFLDKSSQF